MNERERILDLVKKGVLSTEEALDLLESIAKEKDASQIKRAAEEVKANNNASDKIADKTIEELEMEDKENLEAILESLAQKATQASAELDELSVELDGVAKEQAEVAEQLMQLNTKEELGELTADEQRQRQALEQESKDLTEAAEELKAEKEAVEDQVKSIRKQQWKQTKEKVSQKFDIPDDWREQANEKLNQANETLNQVSDKLLKNGSKLGKTFIKTIQTLTDTIGENVEWKNIHVKVPGVAATKFEKTYEFPASEATLIDMKVANGKIEVKQSLDDTVKIEAAIKLYGKLTGEDPEEVFANRSQVSVDEERISIQIPNKRIRADLVIYLPAKTYDHVSIKTLNGELDIKDLEAKDVYFKSTNGNINLQELSATMLEIEGVNGEMNVQSGTIRDMVIESVNGGISITTTPETAAISLVNGDIKCSFSKERLRQLKATSVNGNIKLAVPVTIGLNGTAKTSMGSIQSRLTHYEVIREKKEKMNQLLDFERVNEEMATIDLGTTTGTIYLKDTQSL